jgi:hypothetical protein
MHTDQSGHYLATSSKGNQYIMVLVEVDGNYINTEPMKNKSEGLMIKAYLSLWTQLSASGTVRPTTHIHNNKELAANKVEIKKNYTIQLVPPDNHQQNLAERAIQTFKNHLKAIIAGVDNNFPMNPWDRLLPQTVLTLNLLQHLNIAPTVSAYQYVNGPFDYNKMPLGPMGCAVQIHERNERRGTWAANSVDGWYLRMSPEHYQCLVIYVKHTRSERVSDTVYFKHKHITQPTLTLEDRIVKALNDLTHTLNERRNTKGILEMEALQKIDELLNKIPSPTIPDEATPPTTEKRVTFDQTSKPPKEMQPTPRVLNDQPTPRVTTPLATITNTTIDKPIQTNTPNPKANIETRKDPSFEQTKLRQKIKDVRNRKARIKQ